MVKTIFLDRDGVINIPNIVDSKPYAPRKFHDFVLYDGIEDLLSYFRRLGYLLLVVTNQPDIGNKLMDVKELYKMHNFLCSVLPIMEVIVCPHSQTDDCKCRKPKAGMISEAIKKYDIDVAQSWLIGDRWSDILAGASAGLRTIFVDRHYSESLLKSIESDYRVEKLEQIYETIF
mgnify:CR=1 FL=1